MRHISGVKFPLSGMKLFPFHIQFVGKNTLKVKKKTNNETKTTITIVIEHTINTV